MSRIPLVYNFESVRARWSSSLVAVLGIAGTVAVFVAMLALARGFEATLVASGSPENVIVRRAGSASEMDSAVYLDELRALEDAPGVAHEGGRPLSTAEVVVLTALPMRETGIDANVQARGVSTQVLDVRRNVRLVAGRLFETGLPEIVVGSNAQLSYEGLELGRKVHFGGIEWSVVGVIDAGGSAFDSEIWCDADLLGPAYKRPVGVFQSVTLRLESAAAFERFKQAVEADPRLKVQAEREPEYYEKESQLVKAMILGLGMLVAIVMGVGAVVGALNTMYGAVAERTREIATLRALGFVEGSVVASFLLESLLIALVGGLVGCAAVLPINGLTTGTMNWQTFAHMAFAFQVTPDLLAWGLAFSLLMGLLGGLPPAIRAARLPVAGALRDL